jgi:hypothetical protein
MRITREKLINIAKNTVDQRTKFNSRLVCVYLTGSVLSEEPLFGGSTDIDLIFVHNSEPPWRREIEPVNQDIHLDILHFSQDDFHPPRRLRQNAWLGSYLCESPMVLYDLGHWFEFTQAGAFAHFNRQENILARALPFTQEARKLWMQLSGQTTVSPETIGNYLNILELSAQSIACLSGAPLTERRFMTAFQDRVALTNRPGLAEGLTNLFTGRDFEENEWEQYLQQWRLALETTNQTDNPPQDITSCRVSYYQKAIEVYKFEHIPSAYWLMLRTWTKALNAIKLNTSLDAWQSFCKECSLDNQHFPEKLRALDAYLDAIETLLDDWRAQYHI